MSSSSNCAALLALLWVTGLAACASRSTQRSATPLAAKQSSISAAVGASVFEHGDDLFALPILDLLWRRGLTGHRELGVKLSMAGAELSLLHALAPRGSWKLAAMVGWRTEFVPVTNNDTDALRTGLLGWLLAERPLGPRHSLRLAVKLEAFVGAPATIFRGVAPEVHYLIEPGVSVGLAVKLWGRVFIPELGAQLPYEVVDNQRRRPALYIGVGMEL